MAKSEIRSWTVDGRAKKLFSFKLSDRSGELTGVAFNSQAEVFYEKIQTGKCFRISLYQTRQSKYSQSNSRCEIHLTKVFQLVYRKLFGGFIWIVCITEGSLRVELIQISRVVEIDGEDIPCPDVFKTRLVDLLKESNMDTVTIVGIVYEIQEIQDVACRDGKARRKQTVSLVDDSGYIVHCHDP